MKLKMLSVTSSLVLSLCSVTALAGSFKLNPERNQYSNLAWPFLESDSKWKVTTGSDLHSGADRYADDYNYHDGNKGGDIDLGKSVYSVMGGKVIYADRLPGYGYGNQVVVLDDSGKFAVRYAHLNSMSVSEGDTITRQSTLIGGVGKTGLRGSCTAPNWACAHLHIVLYENLSRNDISLLKRGKMPSSSSAAWFRLDASLKP
ncbi:M23 family metallopeptidase [Pseudoalteromonas rubra]|uniref:M23 family metallopeptidase n=1 Tax=Pseudoalteromonas rubra TaxID=43658 RepID=UPI000F7A6946|nr:M23 family metallopeptidase [Pseudoalteromonas rubra]